jgi:hypothetical protein
MGINDLGHGYRVPRRQAGSRRFYDALAGIELNGFRDHPGAMAGIQEEIASAQGLITHGQVANSTHRILPLKRGWMIEQERKNQETKARIIFLLLVNDVIIVGDVMF